MAFTKPEAIALIVDASMAADVSDLDTETHVASVAVAQNPSVQQMIEDIQFDGEGNLYAVVDSTNGDSVSSRGIAVLHRAAARAGDAPDVVPDVRSAKQRTEQSQQDKHERRHDSEQKPDGAC